jgi:hypothetical protein
MPLQRGARPATSSAAAPSVTPLELPAVTLPPSLRNAGRSDASFSRVICGRGKLVVLEAARAAAVRHLDRRDLPRQEAARPSPRRRAAGS